MNIVTEHMSQCSVLQFCFYCMCPLKADPEKPVLVAGDPERLHEEECRALGGIPYHLSVVNYMVKPSPQPFLINGSRVDISTVYLVSL